MKRFRHACSCGIVALALGATATSWGAEIPADLDAAPVNAVQVLEKAGLSHDEAVSRAETLDAVELAQLGRTDLDRKGGDALSFTILMAAAVILGLMWIFTVCESKG